jgi:hypothetical protein
MGLMIGNNLNLKTISCFSEGIICTKTWFINEKIETYIYMNRY